MHGAKQARPIPPQPPAGAWPAFLTVHPDGVTLALRVQPRASRNEIGPGSGPELRIKVTAPPVDAAANEAVLRLLAETLACPRRLVVLVRGQTTRQKVAKVFGVTPAQVLAQLARS